MKHFANRSMVVPVVLFSIMTSTASAQVFQSAVPVVRDSANQVLGPVIDFERVNFVESLLFCTFFEGEAYFLRITRPPGQPIDGLSNATPYFTTNNCTGDPYLLTDALPQDLSFRAPFAFREVPDLVLFRVSGGVVSSSGLTAESRLLGDGTCDDSISFSLDTGGFHEAVLVPTGFVGPYSITQGDSIEFMGASIGIPLLSNWGLLLMIAAILLANWFVRHRFPMNRKHLADGPQSSGEVN